MSRSEFEEGVKRWLLEMLEADEDSASENGSQERKDENLREALALLEKGDGYECAELIFADGVAGGDAFRKLMPKVSEALSKSLHGGAKGRENREFFRRRYQEGLKSGAWATPHEAAPHIVQDARAKGFTLSPDDDLAAEKIRKVLYSTPWKAADLKKVSLG